MTASRVPSATRTLRVLRYLASRPAPSSLETIARACDLPRSTAYHLLNTMIAEGFVVHDPRQHRFALGLSTLEAGAGFVRHSPLLQVARAPMASAVDRLGVSCYLAIPQGRDVVLVLEDRAPLLPPLLMRPTLRIPARSTSPGHAWLAALPPHRIPYLYPGPEAFEDGHHQGPRDLRTLEATLAAVRAQGYASERSALHSGLCTVAAAIENPDPTSSSGPVGTVGVAFRPERTETSGRLGGEVVRLSREIGAHLVGAA